MNVFIFMLSILSLTTYEMFYLPYILKYSTKYQVKSQVSTTLTIIILKLSLKRIFNLTKTFLFRGNILTFNHGYLYIHVYLNRLGKLKFHLLCNHLVCCINNTTFLFQKFPFITIMLPRNLLYSFTQIRVILDIRNSNKF